MYMGEVSIWCTWERCPFGVHGRGVHLVYMGEVSKWWSGLHVHVHVCKMHSSHLPSSVVVYYLHGLCLLPTTIT